jgi:hypothetical protein
MSYPYALTHIRNDGVWVYRVYESLHAAQLMASIINPIEYTISHRATNTIIKHFVERRKENLKCMIQS